MPALVEGGRGIALVGPDTLMPIWRSLLAVWISASRQEQRDSLPEGLGGGPQPRGITEAFLEQRGSPASRMCPENVRFWSLPRAPTTFTFGTQQV